MFQIPLIGVIPNTMSVTVVYALAQYEKSSETAGSQHVTGIEGFQSRRVVEHCRKTIEMDTMANMTCSMDMV